jgi:two-component system, LuxR family, response regulator FixJ
MTTSTSRQPTVFVVDDDPSALKAACYLIESFGLSATGFSSARQFLDAFDPEQPGCLVLDMRMPGMTGLELQRHLVEAGVTLPIVIVSGHGDVASCAQAFRAGAVDFLEKPVSDDVLLERLKEAIAKDARIRRARKTNPQFFARLSQLTPREREVMELLAQGRSMKQIAMDFGISIQTASKHRLRLLEKLGVANDIELVKTLMSNSQG